MKKTCSILTIQRLKDGSRLEERTYSNSRPCLSFDLDWQTLTLLLLVRGIIAFCSHQS